MSATARAAWLDAWESPSTPSPYGYRENTRRSQGWGYAPRSEANGRDISDWTDESDWTGTAEEIDLTGAVVRLSDARAHRGRRGGPRFSTRHGLERRPGDDTRCRNMSIPEVPAIEDYDWEAAARRRPGTNEYERVILHAGHTAEAHMTYTNHYGREAVARAPEAWPEASRRSERTRLRVVKYKVPRWRLGLLAAVFGVLVVGLTIVAPMMVSSAVAGVEAAVGQAEDQQEQLAADTTALAAQISSLSSPQRVAEEAEHLGLVPAGQVSYVPSEAPMLASEGDTTVAGR